MYIPEHFAGSTEKEALDFVSQYGFGTIMSSGPSGLNATHLPFLVDQHKGKPCLLGHFARANDHWSYISRHDTMIVFSGPHCYISPSWYASPNVPTWNYMAAHVYGNVEILDDHDFKHRIVLELSDYYERNLSDPWIPDYNESMLDAIVGFRFNISRIEAKQKLSQNKSVADRKGAIEALRKSGSDNESAIADLMEQSLSSQESLSG
jgi:transcriptional regulator